MGSTLQLDEREQRWLSGADGEAMRLAMQMMVTAADVSDATEFVEIEFAHINSSFYSGQVSLDFAEFLLANGGSFAVPTHTNASLIDCSTPELRAEHDHPVEVGGARRLMAIYAELGASAMWSCAPYAEPTGRPRQGAHVVGSESNAVSFFNSVLGARTNKYGDFIDVCAAMTGRVPLAGLHTDAGRRASHVFDLTGLSGEELADSTLPHVLGIILGHEAGSAIPVVVGLDTATEDDLKAIAAAGGTSGAVEMFHVVGVTPEARTLDAATAGVVPAGRTIVDSALVRSTRARLSTSTTAPLSAVCLGTPHFTASEFAGLRAALDGRPVDGRVQLLVTTSRAVLAEIAAHGWDDELRSLGVQIVLDTCTYYSPRARGVDGLVMTNSAKWAYYAPGILGVDVAFGSLPECVDAAVSGKVGRRD
ncbi:MAG: DUF521 domain-containing protein [Ilumatobacter sp.]|nr:DUF521 domain-containing protein [Ilumatobacter sp.]